MTNEVRQTCASGASGIAARETAPVPPAVLLAAGVIAISFSAIFIKWCSAPAPVIGAWRLWLSALLLSPAAWRQRHAFATLSSRDWGLLLASGGFLGLHFLFWIGSLHTTSVASSMIITALQPLFVMIGAFWAFGERTPPMGWWGVAVAMAGSALIPLGDRYQAGGALYGDLLSLLGTVAISGYLLVGQAVRSRLPSVVYNLVVFSVAALVLSLASAGAGIPLTGYPAQDWGWFVLLAVIPTLFGHALFNWLLRFVEAATISVTALGEPVGAIVLAALLLREPVRWPQVVGGLLVLTGVALYLHTIRRHPSASRA
ncbi:DMT family transporter [Alicyclobacillus macrosporangiidus]|uniref:DMT family transporter n=1 Tax=Alicyclobacillus macrosporangiidus TaxID=392015 RepID=UPI000AE1954F|nr:DMT family transporter [Alicyclobacillus macrosporangiidus]